MTLKTEQRHGRGELEESNPQILSMGAQFVNQRDRFGRVDLPCINSGSVR